MDQVLEPKDGNTNRGFPAIGTQLISEKKCEKTKLREAPTEGQLQSGTRRRSSVEKKDPTFKQ